MEWIDDWHIPISLLEIGSTRSATETNGQQFWQGKFIYDNIT
jgi:hypothetical protein